MKKVLMVLLMLACIAALPALANESGPTLIGVVEKILIVSEADGYWIPSSQFSVLNVQEGDMKAAIYDSAGKEFAYVIYDVKSQGVSDQSGNWYTAHPIKKWVPQTDNYQSRKFEPGNYTLKVSQGGKLLFETPFEVYKIVDPPTQPSTPTHYAIDGPWRGVVYITPGTSDHGLCTYFWYAAPRDLSWYNPSGRERPVGTKVELLNNGKVIETQEFASNGDFYMHPWSMPRSRLYVGYENTIKEKMLSKDGEYEVLISGLLRNQQWFPLAKAVVQVKGGMIQPNPELQSAGPKGFIGTKGSNYQKNLIKEKLPPYSEEWKGVN